jgi:DNA-binding MarR family transcriptional regulator
MHPLFFGVKRLYWLLVRCAGGLLMAKDLWVTPARFDLLRALHKYPKGIARFKLVRLLGVSGPVVSRMLKALEAEGWLTRTRAEHDRRVVMVLATPAARSAVEDFLNEKDGIVVAKEAASLFVSSKRARVRRRELQIFERFLVRARARLNDKAPFTHPWFGGEIVAPDGWLQLIAPPPTFAPAAPLLNEVVPPLHVCLSWDGPCRLQAST